MILASHRDEGTNKIYQCGPCSGVGNDPLLCTFCGSEHPVGAWHAYSANVLCCRSCAVGVLPKLAADSITSNGSGGAVCPAAFLNAVASAKLAFWKAAASAFARISFPSWARCVLEDEGEDR